MNDEKLLKIGLGFGRGDARIEGNFQMGWHRRCNKKYHGHPVTPVVAVKSDGRPPSIIEESEEDA